MAKRDVPGFFDGVVVNDTLEAGFESLKGALLATTCLLRSQPER